MNGLVFDELVRCMVEVEVFCLWLVCSVKMWFIVCLIVGIILYFFVGMLKVMCRKLLV